MPDMQLEFMTESTMTLNISKNFFSNSKCCASAHIDVFVIVLSNEDNSTGVLYSILGRYGLWKYYLLKNCNTHTKTRTDINLLHTFFFKLFNVIFDLFCFWNFSYYL